MTPEPPLKQILRRLGKPEPSTEDLAALQNYPDRNEATEHLVVHLDVFIDLLIHGDEPRDSAEWEVIHICKVLGEWKPPAAAGRLVALLCLYIDYEDSVVFNDVMIALENYGESALEPAFLGYVRDFEVAERRSTWLYVLSGLGVHDLRIRRALVEYYDVDQQEAIGHMAGYGDRELLSFVEEAVLTAAHDLRERGIDPFSKDDRFADESARLYVDGRESLVILKYGLKPSDPEFERRVAEFDQKYVGYDPAAHNT